MQKLMGYERATNSFVQLTWPQIETGWEYKIYFNLWWDNPKDKKDHQAQHYVYCRDFNDLSVVLSMLSPMLNNEGTHANYSYVGDPNNKG